MIFIIHFHNYKRGILLAGFPVGKFIWLYAYCASIKRSVMPPRVLVIG